MILIAAWVIGYVLAAAFFYIFLKRVFSIEAEDSSLMATVWPAVLPAAAYVIVLKGLARIIKIIADKLEGIIKP